MAEAPKVERYSPAFYAWQLPVAKFFAWLLMTVLGPFRWFHRERVPKQGGLLILSNHLSDCDPIAIQVACPRPVRFMAKRELFSMPFVRTWLHWLKCFPVTRGEADRAAIKQAVALLEAGECVCVFPEGQLSETGELQELKSGVALIVRMAGVPVQCVRLRNTNRIIPYGSYLPRPSLAWVEARWGAPKTFDRDADAQAILGWAASELGAPSGADAR